MDADSRKDPAEALTPPAVDGVDARVLLGELRAQMFGRRERVVVGRFELRELLGRGTYGSVYLAEDAKLQRSVAVKLLATESDPTARARLLREAQALAQLKHPNVLTIHDVGLEDDRVFIAMEYVEGGTLASWCRKHPAGTTARFREVLSLALGTARGLAAAHAAGIVHRDVKPANILVGDDGRPRIADFGLARAGSATETDDAGVVTLDAVHVSPGTTLTRTGDLLGTPAYMAPERLAGQGDVASDQWSLCAAFWEAAYGERPFVADDIEGLRKAVRGRPSRPPNARKEVPAWWREILTRGLDPDPALRWPSVAALASALERAAARRRARRLALAGGVLALGALAAAGAWWLDLDRRRAQCRDDAEAITDVWNAGASERLRAALASSGVTYAETAFTHAVPYLDAYAGDWRTRHAELCLAAVDGPRTPELWDASRRCFDERKGELAALLGVLTDDPDATAVERMVGAVAHLGRLERCADDAWLGRQVTVDEAGMEQIHDRLWHVVALDAAGRYDEGLAHARDLCAVMAEHPGARLKAQVLLVAGRLGMHAGAYDEAHERMTEAFHGALAAGEEDLAVETAIMLVFLLGGEMARYDEAVVWGRVGEALLEQLGDSHRLDAAALANHLGSVAWAQGHHGEAERAYERALETLQTTLGEEHPDVAMVRNNLATVYQFRGQLAEAERAHAQVLAIRQRVLGEEHPATASSHYGLGNSLWAQGRLAEAELAFDRALSLRARVLGPHHPDTATTRGGLANVYVAQGRLEEAEQALKDVRDDLTRTLGPGHPHVVLAHENLGNVYGTQKRYDDAERELLHALAGAEEAYAPDHPHLARILYNLGWLYRLTDRHAESERAHARGLAVQERRADPDRAEMVDSLVGLAVAKHEQGRADEAIGDAERALAIVTSLPGSATEIASVRFVLARALAASGTDRARAIELAQEARDAYRAAGDDHATDLAEVERWLAR